MDSGKPIRTTTATLVVDVTDVNDNPPYLAEPRSIQVTENGPPHQRVAQVKFGDPDDWRLGHGPPFTVTLDPRASPYIQSKIKVTLDKNGDDGGGIGLVWTRTSLDREECVMLLVPLLVSDGGWPSLTTTRTLTIHVDDVNDNPMLSAAKTITVHTIHQQQQQQEGGMVSLGRVYVQDPDDWQEGDKTYAWGQQKQQQQQQQQRQQQQIKQYQHQHHHHHQQQQQKIHHHHHHHQQQQQQQQHQIHQHHQKNTQQKQKIHHHHHHHHHHQKQQHQHQQHPGFYLDTHTGHLTMESNTVEGRYELMVRVTDESQGQRGVRANVSIEVKWLSMADLTYATPFTLTTHPHHLVKEREGGESLLKRIERTVSAWVRVRGGVGVSAVWAEAATTTTQQQQQQQTTSTTRVWLVTPGINNLHHILLYRMNELSKILGVGVQEVGVGGCGEAECGAVDVGGVGEEVEGVGVGLDKIGMGGVEEEIGMGVGGGRGRVGGGRGRVGDDMGVRGRGGRGGRGGVCLRRALVKQEGYSVLDMNRWCIPTSETHVRCICPHGTFGSRCKILTRHFHGRLGGGVGVGGEGPMPTQKGGWAGSSSSSSSGGGVILTLNTSYSLADNSWHRIDIIWKDELVELIVDLCSGGMTQSPPSPPTVTSSVTPTLTSSHDLPPDAHTCRGAARLSSTSRVLRTSGMLQVGGVANPSEFILQGLTNTPSLRGCLRNLRINGKLVDLGTGVVSEGSTPGCPQADCSIQGLDCGIHARCEGSPGLLWCECEPGWAGSTCITPTTPVTFLHNSYINVNLSFTPPAYSTSISLRFRTWMKGGELVVLWSRVSGDSWCIHMMEGVVCSVLHIHPTHTTTLCLTRSLVADGQWHSLHAIRYGSASFLMVDDSDDGLYNSSVVLEGRQALRMEGQAAVRLGGSPEYKGLSLVKVHNDLRESCIDDLRISGRRVILPPTNNNNNNNNNNHHNNKQTNNKNNNIGGSSETFTYRSVKEGCYSPSVCYNVTCQSPLTCVDNWRSFQCGCGKGEIYNRNKSICEDENECVWRPCLNGGTCFNIHPGYVCGCSDGFSGQHCHLAAIGGKTSLKISLVALVAILVWCVCILLVVCAFLLHQHHRRSSPRKNLTEAKEGNTHNTKGTTTTTTSTPCQHNNNPNDNLLQLQLLKPPRTKFNNGHPPWTKNPNIADVDVLQVDAAFDTSSTEEQQQQQAILSCLSPTNPENGRRITDVARDRGKKERTRNKNGGRGVGMTDDFNLRDVESDRGKEERMRNKGGGGEERRGGGGEKRGRERGGGEDREVEERRVEERGGEEERRGGGEVPRNSMITDDLRNYAYEGDGSSPGSLSSCLESCNGSDKLLMGGFGEVSNMLDS
ncbi:hypothetical protein Pmani_014399 [Petrolisthes manimaculis]|uniref:Neural-cadherin n=1 Tax=Petrolisthes manimaculis TaxID=1843537 RepID=A0AAE1PVE9_9EUCA|nr:hypothetical protein Pmani_014399 [Petrolisthes manimaculis]